MRRSGLSLVTRPVPLTVLLMSSTVLFAMIEMTTTMSPSLDRTSGIVTLASLVSCVSVLGMKRWPWLVMATSLASLFLTFFMVAPSPMAYFLIAVGGVSVANWGRFAALSVPIVGVVSVVALVTSPSLDDARMGLDAAVLYSAALPVLLASLAVAVGLAARQQQQVMAQLRSQHDELEELQRRETDAAIVSERARISRELHDVVAHHVSALLIEAQAGQRIAVRGDTPDVERWHAVTDVARETLQSMRRMVRLLRSTDDRESVGHQRDPQPRIADLDRLVQSMDRTGLEVHLDRGSGLESVPSDLQLGVYRIVQEALTNVLRHASASRAVVRVALAGAFVTAEIRDDGTIAESFRPGNGLLGMRERVASLGGNLDLVVEPGAGLRIFARLPLDSPLAPRIG